MNYMISPEHMTEALARAHEHWLQRHAGAAPGALTIAISRETGTYGAAIARELADRLGWPVYDRELLQRIADDMGVRRTLLESVDERREGWLTESLASLFSIPRVNEEAYFRHLVETLFSLGAHGDCVIVGRGATIVLPTATTLRVRLVAPLEHRIAAIQHEDAISAKEAAAQIATKDRERNRFITSHFPLDPADPENYDLVLNTARFSKEECADFIIAALGRLARHPQSDVTAYALHATAGA